MDFKKFPIDGHECEFRITSAYLDSDHMKMKLNLKLYEESQRPLQYTVNDLTQLFLGQ